MGEIKIVSEIDGFAWGLGEDFHFFGATPAGDEFAGAAEDLKEFDVDAAPRAETFEDGTAIFLVFARGVREADFGEAEDEAEVVLDAMHV